MTSFEVSIVSQSNKKYFLNPSIHNVSNKESFESLYNKLCVINKNLIEKIVCKCCKSENLWCEVPISTNVNKICNRHNFVHIKYYLYFKKEKEKKKEEEKKDKDKDIIKKEKEIILEKKKKKKRQKIIKYIEFVSQH